MDRRTVIGVGALALGASGAAMPIQAAGSPGWRPSVEAQDAWMDKPGTRHRLMFDTTTAGAVTAAMYYADTFYAANKSGYGLDPSAIGLIIVMRHFSTPYGFTDSVWVKYGATIASVLKLKPDEAARAAKGNPLLAAPPAPPPNAKPGSNEEAVTLATLAAKGARFAVCGIATQGMAGQLAKMHNVAAKTVEDELKASLIPGGIIVPAGIVAVNRTQEYGYAFVTIAE